jgi:hypothetical protein
MFLQVLLLCPVCIIPWTLHTHLHLHVALTGATNGRSMGTCQTAKPLSWIEQHCKENNFHLSVWNDCVEYTCNKRLSIHNLILTTGKKISSVNSHSTNKNGNISFPLHLRYVNKSSYSRKRNKPVDITDGVTSYVLLCTCPCQHCTRLQLWLHSHSVLHSAPFTVCLSAALLMSCSGGCRFSVRQTAVFRAVINLLTPEFGISILAHPVCKMRIIQEPKKIALWNKRHFEEKKTKSVQHV